MNLEIHRSETGKNVFLDLIGDLDMAGAPVLRQSVANLHFSPTLDSLQLFFLAVQYHDRQR